MKIRRNRPEPPVDRRLPAADLSGFQAPEIIKIQKLKESDMAMIKSLSEELQITGVIDREVTTMSVDQTLFHVNEMFTEAEEHQTYEKEITPERYDPNTESFLENRELTEGDLFDNPSLDGIDDYGKRIYDEPVHSKVEDTTYSNVRTDGIRDVENVSEDHSKSAAIRLPDGTIIYGELL